MPQMLRLARITRSGDFQIREHTDQAVVSRYTESAQEQAQFPPLIVWHDEEEDIIYLVDGYHRLAAYENANVTSASVEFFQGSRREALEKAIECNFGHGAVLKPQDIKKACLMLMAEMANDRMEINQSEIARRMGVSRSSVSRWFSEIEDTLPDYVPPEMPDPDEEDPLAGLSDDEVVDSPKPMNPNKPRATPGTDPKKPVTKMIEVADFKARFTAAMNALNRFKEIVDEIRKTEYGCYLAQADKRFTAHFKAMKEIIRSSGPACVCPHCNGDGCAKCENNGWLSIDQYESAENQS